jgi:prepilin-type N-terminal cleavage/methylation domain-containing protein
MQIQTHVLKNNQGLTLVEVLIAMVVFLLVSLAMMQTALVGIDSNSRNFLRDEAVSVTEIRMNEARNVPFASLISDAADVPIVRNIRNITGGVTFNTRVVVTELDGDGNLGTDDANIKQINVTNTWEWRDNTVANGNAYTHRISTIRKR